MHDQAISLRQRCLNGWRRLERGLDAAFGSGLNPMRHLGSIGLLAFWLLAASGVLLYIVIDTSVVGARRSIDSLSSWPLQLGVLLRGLHRYAADALVLAMGAHLLREWLHGHERGVRRFPWLTGVPLIGFVFISAIGGFWINWDQLGQFSAVATAEWLGALPMLATPLARNFLANEAVGDRLFSLFIFVHLGVPLLLLFGLWFHIQRLTRVAMLPPRPLTLGLVTTLALLALVWPVRSAPPADLGQVPALLQLDWLLLWLHPLTYATSPEFTWVLMGAAALLLLALPFLPQARKSAAPAVAVVDADNCNGCTRCFVDCPYAAVTMVPHPNQRIGRLLAQVDADLCVGCGICAGACPSSTPFRRVTQLVTGIDMPQRPVSAMRAQLQRDLAANPAARPLVVFGCDHGVRSASALSSGADDVSVCNLLCAGQLPPSFVEYALRDGAAGVVVAACREGGCEFRLGERWTAQRLSGQREPHLRDAARGERVELVFAGPGDEAGLAAAVQRLRERVQAIALDPDLPHRIQHA